MITQKVDITEVLITKIQSLRPQQQQVLDFTEFIAQKYVQSLSEQKRVPDLNRGEIWMSEDFNDPLPDEFWVGE